MQERDVDAVLATLTANDYGWRTVLPDRLGRFFGQPVGLEIETREVPAAGSPPAVSEREAALVGLIIENLASILTEARKRFDEANSGYEAAVREQVRDPHIWIDREIVEESGGHRWALVVGLQDWPDFGYHIEFKGLECRGMWAGD